MKKFIFYAACAFTISANVQGAEAPPATPKRQLRAPLWHLQSLAAPASQAATQPPKHQQEEDSEGENKTAKKPCQPVAQDADPSTSTKTPPRKALKSLTQVTPRRRKIGDDFSIARPAKLKEGGRITIDQSARNAIESYLHHREASIISKSHRVETMFSEKLLEKVSKRRSLGEQLETPEKDHLDHALSDELIFEILQSENAQAFVNADFKLTIIAPTNIEYQHIEGKKNLNKNGSVIILCFDLEHQLFHACRQPLSKNQINRIKKLIPKEVTVGYSEHANILTFDFDLSDE